jgi:hypothetical protein
MSVTVTGAAGRSSWATATEIAVASQRRTRTIEETVYPPPDFLSFG